MLPRHGSGTCSRASSFRALDSEQIGDRAGLCEVDQGRVDPVLKRRLVLDQMEAKAGQLALGPDPRVGQPDRRHQVALAQDRQHPRVDLVRLARQRRQPLHPLRVGDLDVPALLLERVVDQAGTGHRLDHTANRLPIALVNPPSQRPQRVHIRRRGEPVDELPRPRQQTDIDLPPTEIQPSVQH
jgi:hypothetical protein